VGVRPLKLYFAVLHLHPIDVTVSFDDVDHDDHDDDDDDEDDDDGDLMNRVFALAGSRRWACGH
jgi:hypothetical protein